MVPRTIFGWFQPMLKMVRGTIFYFSITCGFSAEACLRPK
jgi:hypothetical protein